MKHTDLHQLEPRALLLLKGEVQLRLLPPTPPRLIPRLNWKKGSTPPKWEMAHLSWNKRGTIWGWFALQEKKTFKMRVQLALVAATYGLNLDPVEANRQNFHGAEFSFVQHLCAVTNPSARWPWIIATHIDWCFIPIRHWRKKLLKGRNNWEPGSLTPWEAGPGAKSWARFMSAVNPIHKWTGWVCLSKITTHLLSLSSNVGAFSSILGLSQPFSWVSQITCWVPVWCLCPARLLLHWKA